MKKLIITKLLVLNIIFVFAQAPNGYYNDANGKSSTALRLELQDIIDGHYNVGYDGLWAVYATSDVQNGKVLDIYSTCNFTFSSSNQCGNYSNVCDCYNREHSVPKSWFGSASPMYSDAFHLYPTDGRVNGQRNNYPYGECASGTTLGGGRALGKLGSSTFSGFSGTVFEPDDEYKGDLARTYFYMATRYADKNFTSGEGDATFTYSSSGNPKCNFTAYAKALFLKWHRQDPVSEKEFNRNNAIFAHQNNRNPFIDHPELAEYIWGDSIDFIWNNGGSSAIDEIDFFKPEISPNPTSDFISVNNNDFFQNFDYQIFTIQGKIILTGNSSVNQQINISNIDSGIYFIKISTENRFFVEKIIKN